MVTKPRAPRRLKVVETPLVAAVRQTLAALEAGGRLEEVDAVEVALLRSLAADVDALPAESRSKPQLVRQMTLVLRSLRGNARDDHDLDSLLSRLSASGDAAMGDASY
jgi:hypothetical protein